MSTFFSSLTWQPDPFSGVVVPRDEYGYHQLIWSLFPNYQAKRPFLYHRYARPGVMAFYLLSKLAPQLPDQSWSGETKSYELNAAVGDLFQFRLRFCPTVAVPTAQDQRGKVVSIFSDAVSDRGDQGGAEFRQSAVAEWFEKRTERLGFRVASESLAVSPSEQISWPGRDDATVTMTSCLTDGTLEVTKPDAARQTLLAGIGRGKAFGQGLMLLRRG